MAERNGSNINRRSFVKWSLAMTTIAGLPLSRGLQAQAQTQSAAVPTTDGQWKPAACWHNCGGRCVNKALVVGGVVVRQKTDDVHVDSPDYPQVRGCVRGRAQRHQIFGADRLKYPMKRKNWASGGGDKSLRGRDQWVRISWDEALDLVSGEMKRIRGKYGNESIWLTGNPGNVANYANIFAATGGYVSDWGTTSWGAWMETPKYIGVHDGWINFGTNDRFDMRKSQLIVLWGANPAWSSPGNPSYHYLQCKKAGARFISIDPSYTATAELLDADWYPINPGTDHALALAVMHTLLKEDDPQTNPLIDWDFLQRCTVGFDSAHMPENTPKEENFKDYLLGTFTGEPKTPEWAESICGISAERIKQLARQIGSTQRTALLTGWAPARINNGEGWVHAFSTLGFMTGHMGKPGRMTGVTCHFTAGNAGTALVRGGGTGLPAVVANPVKIRINHNEINRALLEGKAKQFGAGDADLNIKMMFHGFNATMQTRDNIIKGIEGCRNNVEFIVTPAYVLTTNAKYSDLVLPVTTEWEREGMILNPSTRDVLMVAVNIIAPLYEAKSDQWIAKELGKRLAMNVDEMYPISEKQQFFNTLQGANVVGEDGQTKEPLLTITQADIDQWVVTGKVQTGKITLNQFLEEGVYQVKRQEDDQYGYIAYKDFVSDPQQHPRPTRSGKFEIHCQQLVEKVKSYGWNEIAPIPSYLPKPNGYEDALKNKATGEKDAYPFQVYNPHYLRRSHSTLDNVPHLREAWPNPVFINASDGQRLKIKTGETVLITGPQGKVLRPAMLTETLKPGVVGLTHGAWVDLDEKESIDKAGADNVIFTSIATGLGTSGWNTALCNIEKWHGEQLVEDAKLPRRIIFGEA